MDTSLISIMLIVAVVLLFAVLVVLLFQLRKPQGASGEFSTIVQSLTQSLQQEQTQMATLSEKVNQLTPLTQAIGTVQIEIRGLAEKVAKVEQNQSLANQGIGGLATGLVQTGATLTSKVNDAQQKSTDSLYQVSSGLASEIAKIQQDSSSALAELKALTTGLTETTSVIRAELIKAKTDLAEIQTSAKARQELEMQTANSIRRLETIIAGTQSKGSAGENILEVVFAKLPIEWQIRNFKVGGKPVEFGLKLPNNLILPIDSKWAGTNLVEQFIAATEICDQQQLKSDIENVVIQKAKEVRKYIDPSVTVPFGVVVIPDAVYDLCAGIQADVFQLNVVLVSYSMFVPYLLLVFQTVLKSAQNIDLQKLDSYLQTAEAQVRELQDEIDGRYSRALTMLGNSRDDMRAHLSKIAGSLTGMQVSAATPVTALPEATIAAN